MILDSLNEFCSAVSCAGSAGSALLGAQIDTKMIGAYLGTGQPIYLVIRPTTEIITGGSAGTIIFRLCSDSTAAVSTTTSTVHITTPTYVTDDAAVNSDQLNIGGTIYCGVIPDGPYEEFLGIVCDIGTTTVTAGAIDAFLTTDPASWHAYPDAL